MGWLNKLFNLDFSTFPEGKEKAKDTIKPQPGPAASGASARNRLKLVLMHDRTQLSPAMMEKMRDELVEVIARYVEIDKQALQINFESESNTIALVANIPVLRAHAEETIAKKLSEAESKAETGGKEEKAEAKPKTGASSPAAKTDKVTPTEPKPSGETASTKTTATQ